MYIVWILMAFLLPYLILAIKGPSTWDRLLGMYLISVKIILIITVYASLRGVSWLLDYAIIYTLSGFVGTVFIVFFWSNRQRKRRDK